MSNYDTRLVMLRHMPFNYICQTAAINIEYLLQEHAQLENSLKNVELNDDLTSKMTNLLVDAKCETVIAIVFAAMCLENFIYHYSLHNVSHDYYINHIDKLSPPSKWVIATRLCTRQELEETDQRFISMKEIFATRNEIVHLKGKSIDDPTDKQLKKLCNSLEEYDGNLQKLALRAPRIINDCFEMIQEKDTTEECQILINKFQGRI